MSVTVIVDVQVASSVETVPASDDIELWMAQAVTAVCDDASGEVEVSVRVVDEDEGRELNKRFRDKDQATNVLSFPAEDAVMAQDREGRPRLLGDVVICGPVVEREAQDQGKTAASHWSHMLVHGALHLLGYDHESEAEAVEMEALERKLLSLRGIDDPYVVT